MKKKILLTVMFAFILMAVGYTISNAATYEMDNFKINIPDKYKVEKSSNKIFINDQYINDSGSSVMAASIKATKSEFAIIPDDDFLNLVIESCKKQSEADFHVFDSTLVSINNCRGAAILYGNTTQQGRYYYGVYYALVSDNYIYDIEFVSTSRNYLTGTELNSILKSYKVKDTVRYTNGIPFMDVSRNDWYYNSVKIVSNDGIITGTTDYTYNPSGKLTRGQLATILWRMAGKPIVKGKEFPDVKNTDYYYQAVQWASAKGIVNGYSTGKFGPKDNVTREQLAVMLQNYAKYKKINVSKVADISKFKDVKGISSYATNAVAWAIQNKIVSGKENGTKIDPKGNATRAEAAAMIQNYRTYVK